MCSSLFFADSPVPIPVPDIVILDVEGTIAFHGSSKAEARAASRVAALRGMTTLFICSNASDSARIAGIVRDLGISPLALRGRKPWGILPPNFPRGKTISVFGDKLITDGLFAWRIGARFVKVRRLVSGTESLTDTIVFMLDDFLALFFA